MLPKLVHVAAKSAVESFGGEKFWFVLGQFTGFIDR